MSKNSLSGTTHNTTKNNKPFPSHTDVMFIDINYGMNDLALAELSNLFAKYLGKQFSLLHPIASGTTNKSFWLGDSKNRIDFDTSANTARISFLDLEINPISDWQAFFQLFYQMLKGEISYWVHSIQVINGSQSFKQARELYQNHFFDDDCFSVEEYKDISDADTVFHVYQIDSIGGEGLTVTEKGKELDLPDSPWVEWSFSFSSVNKQIPWSAILNPTKYISARYEPIDWLHS